MADAYSSRPGSWIIGGHVGRRFPKFRSRSDFSGVMRLNDVQWHSSVAPGGRREPLIHYGSACLLVFRDDI